jgi:hypothetical protein
MYSVACLGTYLLTYLFTYLLLYGRAQSVTNFTIYILIYLFVFFSKLISNRCILYHVKQDPQALCQETAFCGRQASAQKLSSVSIFIRVNKQHRLMTHTDQTRW